MFRLLTPHGSSRTLAKAALMHSSPPCSQTGLVQIERYHQSRVLIRIRADAALGFKRLGLNSFLKRREHYVTSQNRWSQTEFRLFRQCQTEKRFKNVWKQHISSYTATFSLFCEIINHKSEGRMKVLLLYAYTELFRQTARLADRLTSQVTRSHPKSSFAFQTFWHSAGERSACTSYHSAVGGEML